jgi:signal transduction histidine kinase
MIQRFLRSSVISAPSGGSPIQNERFVNIYWQIRLYANSSSVLTHLAVYFLVGLWPSLVGAALALVGGVHSVRTMRRPQSSAIYPLIVDVNIHGWSMLTASNGVISTGYLMLFAVMSILLVGQKRARPVLIMAFAWGTTAYYDLLPRIPVVGLEFTQLLELITTVAVVFIVWLFLSRVLVELGRLEGQRARFLGVASHELRNDLTGVVGLASLLADGVPAEEVPELARMIHDQGIDATDLVEDLLTASQFERGTVPLQPATVDLWEEVAGVVRRMERTGIPIELSLTRMAEAEADALRVRQIVRNLCSNARRYGGGRTRVEVDLDGSWAIVRVLDDGRGVPIGQEDSIFLPYRQVDGGDRHAGSVGLGLWISRSLSRAMGGELVYYRRLGWTCFELRLPRAQLATAAIGLELSSRE